MSVAIEEVVRKQRKRVCWSDTNTGSEVAVLEWLEVRSKCAEKWKKKKQAKNVNLLSVKGKMWVKAKTRYKISFLY